MADVNDVIDLLHVQREHLFSEKRSLKDVRVAGPRHVDDGSILVEPHVVLPDLDGQSLRGRELEPANYCGALCHVKREPKLR